MSSHKYRASTSYIFLDKLVTRGYESGKEMTVSDFFKKYRKFINEYVEWEDTTNVIWALIGIINSHCDKGKLAKKSIMRDGCETTVFWNPKLINGRTFVNHNLFINL